MCVFVCLCIFIKHLFFNCLQVIPEQLLSFFSQVGEVKYVRMAGDDFQSTRFALIEFTDQRSVATSLTYNGVMFQGHPIK